MANAKQERQLYTYLHGYHTTARMSLLFNLRAGQAVGLLLIITRDLNCRVKLQHLVLYKSLVNGDIHFDTIH